MGEETMTVKKLYKISDNVQAGRWTAERVGEDAWYVKMEGVEDTALWLSDSKFRLMFDEDEMVVEMTVEELESERLIVRETKTEGYVENGI
jgi:predicted secreted protein